MQFLLPQSAARERLGIPADITKPELAVGRSSLRGPWLQQYDVSLQKRVQLTERVVLGIEANAFDVFSRAKFDVPNANLSSAVFGQITSTFFGSTARQSQLGGRLSF
jgi:hypothetical protein